MKKVRLAPRPPNAKTAFSKYLSWNETAILLYLLRSVNPKVMIEIGCNTGVTAAAVLKNVPSIERYIGIDVAPDFIPTLECQINEVPQQAGWYAADNDRFLLLTRPSMELKAADLEPCDAMFIDGDHSEAAVAHDSLLAKELVRPGGVIIWHDYENPAVGVTKALDRLCDAGWPIVSVSNSWIAYARAGWPNS
jgi:predicted O-methyltransferase YrrM